MKIPKENYIQYILKEDFNLMPLHLDTCDFMYGNVLHFAYIIFWNSFSFNKIGSKETTTRGIVNHFRRDI